MWWYIGTALAGLAILVLQRVLRKPQPSKPSIPTSTSVQELPPAQPDPPKNISTPLKKSGDETSLHRSGSAIGPRDGSALQRTKSPSARNFSPSLRKSGSEAMLPGRKGGSMIQRPSTAKTPSPRSLSPIPSRPTAASPVRERIDPNQSSTPPRREIRSTESPVGSPQLPSGLEAAAVEPAIASSEEAPHEDKLCVLDAKFDIDYWQLLPNLGDLIGEGGYAEVYKAQHDHKVVAVKKFKIDYDALAQGLPPMDLELIRNEIIVLSRLDHPNIMKFFGATLSVPNICIVTEFLEKGSLDDWLRDLSRPLSKRQRVKLGLDTARGLAYMHSLDPLIIHRDIKSANVLLDHDLNGKLSDFGLAKIKSAAFEAPPAYLSSARSSAPAGWKVLENSTPVGTAGWAAPEMLSHKPYNELVDLYSFGVFLWELYSRAAPWDGQDEHTLTDAVLEGKRPEIPKDTPEAMVALIHQCWEEQPWKRPTAAAAASELGKIFANTPVE